MTPEGKVKKRVKDILEAAGAYHNWPVPAGYGVPMLDCVGCHRGEFFMVETKVRGQVLTPRQEFTKALVEECGGKVFIVTGEVETDPNTWPGFTELEQWLSRTP